ncbi:peptidoglycan-binding domain-containing protein [Actinoplanes sp. NPDC049548]|uniref:peptidoglycan-binding domain-containing protein n=1 Tax=Actinoplanes sp. NPDC049548 TaxID=3155152 RepID=UPI00341CF6B9
MTPGEPSLTRRAALVRGAQIMGALGIAASAIAFDVRQNAPRRTLRPGSEGADVAEVQIRVAGWAADLDDLRSARFLPITGRYDAETADAVRRFQRGYQLDDQHGIVDRATWARLDRLAAPDGSTAHFDWTEMLRDDPGRVITDPIRENARRTMYKLEAIRRKLGDIRVTVKCGFHAAADEAGETTICGNLLHRVAAAVDFAAADAPRAKVYRAALTSGFTGVGPIHRHWQHCDSRLELPELGLTTVWYPSGSG